MRWCLCHCCPISPPSGCPACGPGLGWPWDNRHKLSGIVRAVPDFLLSSRDGAHHGAAFPGNNSPSICQWYFPSPALLLLPSSAGTPGWVLPAYPALSQLSHAPQCLPSLQPVPTQRDSCSFHLCISLALHSFALSSSLAGYEKATEIEFHLKASTKRGFLF